MCVLDVYLFFLSVSASASVLLCLCLSPSFVWHISIIRQIDKFAFSALCIDYFFRILIFIIVILQIISKLNFHNQTLMFELALFTIIKVSYYSAVTTVGTGFKVQGCLTTILINHYLKLNDIVKKYLFLIYSVYSQDVFFRGSQC